MTEVIDLCSSPVYHPPDTKQTVTAPARPKLPSAPSFPVLSDDFNFSSSTDDLDFLSTQPKKKRRLSPPDPKPKQAKSSHNLSFLSSDNLDDIIAAECTSIAKTTGVGTTTNVHELASDPITFSSSAPEPRTIRRKAQINIIDLEADQVGDDDTFSLSQPLRPTKAHLSKRTANLLANITGPRKTCSKYESVAHTAKSKTVVASGAAPRTIKFPTNEDDIFAPSPPKPRVKPSRAPAKDKDVREVERAVTKAEKEQEREAERERKRLAKEEKTREKQLAADIAEVNKSKSDKKTSTPEMIVDMARSLEGTSVGNQILEYMKILGVETTFSDDPLDLSVSTNVPNQKGNSIRWRRKVKARYNEEFGHWEPLPVETVETEKHILLHMTAREFFEIAAAGSSPNHEPAAQEKAMTKNLDAHVTALTRRYQDCKPIFLIEGLSTFLRKNKTAENRAYTAAVRSQMTNNDPNLPPPSSQPRRRTKNNLPPTNPDLSTITPDLSETLLLHLQLHHQILLHHTPHPSLSATWIKHFTEHISTIPARHQRMASNDTVGFCMDAGQVRTGLDRTDTYVRMLQEVQRVTPSMAYGIANEFATVGELVRGFRTEGPALLAQIRKSVNRDGAVSERVLGLMVSRRLAKVWLGREEGSVDGIA